eukprot:m.221330 g.221330  ORF g.221330 m.221330 type:complete len:257 (+) comp10562_c0_seq1:259-1029(+)
MNFAGVPQYAQQYPMDMFMEDLDMSGVLPTPATFYDSLGSYAPVDYMGKIPFDPAHLNMADLDNIISPVDCETAIFGGPQQDDGETITDDEEDESEMGEVDSAHTTHEEIFAVEMAEEKPFSPETPLRAIKIRLGGDRRYSPMSPGRPRSKALSSAKLSTSLPATGLSMQAMDNKKCACCGCNNTPMWRDGRDGQRLCNACGIRWQKYGVCCANCHYVPRKLENSSGACRRCSAPLPPPMPTRRRSASTSSGSKPS